MARIWASSCENCSMSREVRALRWPVRRNSSQSLRIAPSCALTSAIPNKLHGAAIPLQHHQRRLAVADGETLPGTGGRMPGAGRLRQSIPPRRPRSDACHGCCHGSSQRRFDVLAVGVGAKCLAGRIEGGQPKEWYLVERRGQRAVLFPAVCTKSAAR